MSLLVLDTGVVSLFVKENLDSRRSIYENLLLGQEGIVSFATIAELLAWANIRGWGLAKRDRLRTILAPNTIDHSSPALCEAWADIRSESRKLGRPMSQNDMWIAASAVSGSVPLATTNASDFRHLERAFALRILSA